MPFYCAICEEESTRICVRCTKDTCSNHLCERCRKCSDCCECEVSLDDAGVREPVRAVIQSPAPAPADDRAEVPVDELSDYDAPEAEEGPALEEPTESLPTEPEPIAEEPEAPTDSDETTLI